MSLALKRIALLLAKERWVATQALITAGLRRDDLESGTVLLHRAVPVRLIVGLWTRTGLLEHLPPIFKYNFCLLDLKDKV